MTAYLSLPKINTKDEHADNIVSTPIDLSETQLSHILTNMVRQQYFNFLEGLLTDNYKNSISPGDPLSPLSLTDIKKCAEYLELKAVRSCMVVNLYRQSILSTLTDIRNDTAKKKLNVNLSTEQICQRKTRRSIQIQTDLTSSVIDSLSNPLKQPKRKHLRNVRVQTDIIETNICDSPEEMAISLDERIRIFERQFQDEDRKRMHNFSHCPPEKRFAEHNKLKENQKRRRSLISLEIPSPHSSVDSSIRRSCEHVDSQMDTGNEGLVSTNVIVETPSALLTTQFDTAGTTADDIIAQELQALFGEDDEIDIFGETINPMKESQITVKPAIESSDSLTDHNHPALEGCYGDTTTFQSNDVTKETQPDYTEELKNSIWPCELHMQKMKLRKVLMQNADKGFRYSEKLRKTFEYLFGPENDDDNSFAPYSPTIELDEILVSSCKMRVAPWIVKHLKPMSDRLIKNRFLFKKVAKHIAERVIIRDQYPDEQQIQRAINDFFETHSYIGSIDDIN